MPYTTIEVSSYHLAVFSEGATIALCDAKGATFATAYVRPESETLTENYQDGSGMYRLYYHQSSLLALVDMLRNERPVYLHYWFQGGVNCHLATSLEPVGEAE